MNEENPIMEVAARERDSGEATPTNQEHAARLIRTGRWIVIGALVPLGAWMTLAPLSMAVVAPAFVKVDLNRRPVQHLEGGIVREVLVRDGQRVRAGEPVVILGNVGVEADLNRARYRANIERATLARLEAEKMLATAAVFPDELTAAARLDERLEQALIKEKALFQARRKSLTSEVALMKTQRGRIEQEISALNGEITQVQSALALKQQELQTNRTLVERGNIARIVITQQEAAVFDYAAKLEERRSEVARAEQRLVDTDLKIKSIENRYAQEANDRIKETAASLGEIEQVVRKLEDAAARQIVAAPASGEIIDLKFTSPGAVVGAGEAIAEVVPSDAKLMIQANVRPEDINHVHRGQRARIRLTAFDFGTSMVTGEVTYVSGDRLVDPASNVAYYSAIVVADAESLQSAGDLKLVAGMPAEVYIEGASQTALQYLLEPLTATIRKAGRPM